MKILVKNRLKKSDFQHLKLKIFSLENLKIWYNTKFLPNTLKI